MSEDLDFRVDQEWLEFKEENPWKVHIPEFARDEGGQEYLRSLGKEPIYKIIHDEHGNETYECNECNTTILAAKIVHAIQDGPFPRPGKGQVFYEDVPYCPKCELEPDFHGDPIESGGLWVEIKWP